MGQCHYSHSVEPTPGYTVGGERPETPIGDTIAEGSLEIVQGAADIVMAAAGLGSILDPCSFSSDTPVEAKDGEKPIDEIQIGDYVLAWNEADGTLGYYEVTATISHIDKVVTKLIIDGERIETTPEHPFYTEEAGWLPANGLKTGMQIRQADGTTGIVWLKWNVRKTQEMYNLTVDTAHTFYVGDGQWLVHNSCMPDLPIRSGNDKTTGILIAGGEETILESGVDGPARLMPKGWPGFDLITRTHVEGHASALMWQNGLEEGTLLINNPPCLSCSRLLPRMLPPNASLRVIVPGIFDEIFRGIH